MDFFLNYPTNKLRDNSTQKILSKSNSLKFHKTISNYSFSELYELNGLSKKLNLGKIYVKDESTRFDLKAFKGLGASYAINEILKDNPSVSVFCTATDGNHGKAVAWSASINKKKSVVYVPRYTSKERIDSISKFGGKVIQLNLNYDQTCKYANKQSSLNNWALVQDTSWEGYEKIPALIMAGYLTHFQEMEEKINLIEKAKVDVIFLQSGVGSWPASCIWYYINRYKKKKPKIVLVEPNESSGVLNSFRNRSRVSPNGNFQTIMAGLNCGIPSKNAWEIIKNGCDASMSIMDEHSKNAMRALFYPIKDDPKIISGESGAAGLGGLLRCINDIEFSELIHHVGLNSESRVLLFNTEGDTDKSSFDSIIKNYSFKN